MKKVFTTVISCLFALLTMAQGEAPQLEFVVELKVKCEGAYQVGQTPHGNRFIIPIVGGTFEGPQMKGTILPGGADYQLQDNAHGRTELEAIYSIRTDDGVNIHVRNRGLICTGQDSEGRPQFYFRTAPQFEAPMDSKYAWLNNAIYVCQPSMGGEQGFICLKVWKVK
ncbi:MAG: DUF3237 domain-containing protein [Bacteroidaceae bacterium]|nr:DUF3237 domain-containing protein [Bacteroidaceae bacterium]MBR3757050.1 DUF3237 domain-containing protein [Bacteroidaceae bacterium]